jgi:hypothetical protein
MRRRLFRGCQSFFVNESLMATVGNVAKAGAPGARAPRHGGEVRGKFGSVFAVAFFVTVLAAYLLVGAAVIFGTMRTHMSSDPTPLDDRVARISRPLPDSTSCRNMIIDNRTSQTVEDKVGPCELGRGKSKVRSKPEFVWGGK